MIADPAHLGAHRGLKPAAAYLRRSTDKQEQSLTDQRAEITRWAAAHGHVIVHEYIDDAISGTSAKHRPGFMQMIADAGKRKFTAVVVWNSDRFSRGDVTETEYYRYQLREAGVTVHSVTESYIADEGIAGDVMRTVRQHMNRQYSVSLSQNTLRGQISSVLKQSDPGRLPPFGFDREILGPDGTVLYRIKFLEGGDRETYDKDGRPLSRYFKGQSLAKPGKECSARLVLSDESRVQVVKDIFAMCGDGRGFKHIAAELNRRGVLSPRGKVWQHTTIKAMVENAAYRGDVVWNRRTQSKFFEVRKGRAESMKATVRSGSVEMTAREDWITVEGVIPAIVDRATWDRAQRQAAKRSDAQGGKGKSERWLLSGVLRCGACGHPFWGLNKKKGHIEGRSIVSCPYYICAGRCRSGASVCPHAAHVKAVELEAWVLGELQKLVFADGGGVEDAIEGFVQSAREGHPTDSTIRTHRVELAKIDSQVDALVAGLDPENVSLINSKLTALRKRKEHLAEQVRLAEAQESALDETALRRFASERIGVLADIMAGRRDEKARQVIASYIDEIVIEPETKTGYLAVNASLLGDGPDGGDKIGVGEEGGADDRGAHGATSPSSAHNLHNQQNPLAAQKPDDPAGAGSQVKVIAGARVDLNLRPPGRRLRRFRWGSGGVEGCGTICRRSEMTPV